MSKIIEFSELLMTKFCHDLAGPIGAINNGIEFLEEPNLNNIHDKAMELIVSNSKEAASKLKFFRYIYGITQSSGEADLSEVKDIANDFFTTTNVILHWAKESSDTFTQLTHRASKLLLNMIYSASSVLIAGGEITISVARVENGKSISLIAKGDRLKEINDITHILSNHEMRDIKLNNVQIHNTAKIASEIGTVVKCEFKDEKLKMQADLI